MKFILSTWMYDFEGHKDGIPYTPFKEDGEYAGLNQLLTKDKSWVDYLLIDAHEKFPEYPLKKGTPGGLPYSEGIFEDINKVMCSQFYWNPDRTTEETVKEYIAYEYSPAVVDKVWKAIELLEHNHMRKPVEEKKIHPSGNAFLYGVFIEGMRDEFLNPDRSPLSLQGREELQKTSKEALKLIQEADTQLTPCVRASWRWRVLYLRAVIDKELVCTDGWFEGAVLKAAFEELTKIYHSENTSIMVHVPRIEDSNLKFSEQ